MNKVYRLNKMKAREFFPGFHGKMIHGEKSTMAYWSIDRDHSVPLHHHPHEQFVNMLEGTFRMIMDGKEYLLEAGDVLHIPSNIPHEGTAVTDCRILDVFTPVREAYR